MWRREDALGLGELRGAMASAAADGVCPVEMAKEAVNIVTQARRQAQQLIERLSRPDITSWAQLVELFEAALARVPTGQLLEEQVAASSREMAEKDAKGIASVRAEVQEVIAQLEPQHIGGKFQLSEILKAALCRAQVWQYFHEAH